jgi:adenosylhomocysteinase
VNLGCATGHPSFVMSNSFTNQTMAQIELYTNPASIRSASTRCPRTWTRRWRVLHLKKLGVKLDKLTPAQAAYLGVPVKAPLQAVLSTTTGIDENLILVQIEC